MTAKTARAPNGGYGADRYRSEKFGIDPDRGRERASVYAERFGVATSMGRLSPPVRGPPGRGVRRKRPKAASPWFSSRTAISASANSQTPAHVPSNPKHLDFLRSPRACIGAPRIPGFCPVGFVWNSLDSLVRNEPFQWVTSDPGPNFILSGPLLLLMRRKRQNVGRANTLAGRKGSHGIRHREGPIGHWDQTTAALPFLQRIVVSI